MPPFLRKFVRAKGSRKIKKPRGDGLIVVRDALAETPSIGSSSSSGTIALGNDESCLVPIQSLTREPNTLSPDSGSFPPEGTASCTIGIPSSNTAFSMQSSLGNGSNELPVHAQPAPAIVTSTIAVPAIVSPASNTRAIAAPTILREPPKTISRSSYSFARDIIPYFDGNPGSVAHLISQCRVVDDLFEAEDQPYLLAIIRSRIDHIVYTSIVGDEKPQNIKELVSLIKATYRLKFDFDHVQEQLKTARRGDHETIEQFGFRVETILQRGTLAAREDLSPERFDGIKAQLTESAVRGFLRGLRNVAFAGAVAGKGVKSLRSAIDQASEIGRQLGLSHVFNDSPKILATETHELKCFNCGKTGHKRASCLSRRDYQARESNHGDNRCRNCGKSGHTSSTCQKTNTNRAWGNARTPVVPTPGNQNRPLNSTGAPMAGAPRRTPLIARAESTVSAVKPA